MTKKTEIKKVRCNICSAGCPIDAYVQYGKLLSVEGSRDWPGQQGGLCSKGAASRQYVYNKDRILYPMKRVGERGSGEFERISWEEAYAMIANNLLHIRAIFLKSIYIFFYKFMVIQILFNDHLSHGQCQRSVRTRNQF